MFSLVHYTFLCPLIFFFFFFNDTATTEIYTLSLHDALPIWRRRASGRASFRNRTARPAHARRSNARGARQDAHADRSEEHTSELQSPCNLVCRLLLEKKKNRTRSSRKSALACNSTLYSRKR